MSVRPKDDEGTEQYFLLRDYASLKRYWRVRARREAVIGIEEPDRCLDEAVHGGLERWALAGLQTVMGFLFSLILTCRANDVDRFEYLRYIFEHLPTATTEDDFDALLPWNVKPILEERRKQRDAALRSAGIT